MSQNINTTSIPSTSEENSKSSTLHLQSSSLSSSFQGFSKGSEFNPSVAVITTFGTVGILSVNISHISSILGGIFIIILSLITHHWFWLHGKKMTRNESVMFDEANLLETSNLFEYNYGPITEGTTPISGPDKNPEAPNTVWQALFSDDKHVQMSKFYKEHYGPVWETALKHEKEWKQIKKEKTDKERTDTERSQNSTKTAVSQK